MKTFYKYFDYFLNLLIVSTILAAAVIAFLLMHNFQFSQNASAIKGAVFTGIVLFVFVTSIFYLLIGVILWIVNRKNPKKVRFAKKLFFNGLLKGILSFISFFIVSLALSFFGLGQPDCLCLPKIPDPNTPGFPVADLQIIAKKNVPPQSSDDTWTCDITIKNNNASKTAVSLSFSNADDEDEEDDDSIKPGQTRVITVDNNDAHTLQNPCKGVSLTGAEIYNPDQ